MPREQADHADHAPSTRLFAEHALAAVLVPPFGLVHPHVHGHVPLIPVGLPAAQVGVGVVYESNVGLQAPLIHATFAFEQLALVPPLTLSQFHVEFHPQDPGLLDTEVPAVHANCTELLQTPGVPQACVGGLTHAVQPLEAGVVMILFLVPSTQVPHHSTQSTRLFAEHALAAVLVPPFGLVHPHVHGHVPLMAVGFPEAQVGVGVVSELNVGLQAPLMCGSQTEPFQVYHPLQLNPHDATGAMAQLVVGVHAEPFQVWVYVVQTVAVALSGKVPPQFSVLVSGSHVLDTLFHV